MKNINYIEIIYALLVSSLLIGCSQRSSNIDFDFKTFKKPTNITTKKEDKKNINIENNLYIKNLIPQKSKEKILLNTKFGKKDPFSKSDIQFNLLNSAFKLTGFLNSKSKAYALVIYLDNQGALTEESVGGINTNLLPNGAKVIKIDSKNNKLTIYFDNEEFIFEL